MRDKTALLQDLGVGGNYNPHAGLRGEIKDVILTEVLIDIRDGISIIITLLGSLRETLENLP